MASGVQAEIGIDRDRETNEVSVFAGPLLKCRVVKFVLPRFLASQLRCRARGYSAQAESRSVQIGDLEEGRIRVCKNC